MKPLNRGLENTILKAVGADLLKRVDQRVFFIFVREQIGTKIKKDEGDWMMQSGLTARPHNIRFEVYMTIREGNVPT